MSGERREITPQTREYLLYILDRLRHGYTGEFHLKCNQGGIQRVREDHNVDLDGWESSRLAQQEELG